jgi:branched-chain amino acid transport system substrate-binding protein
MKGKTALHLAVIILGTLLLTGGMASAEDVIHIGGITDQSGATSDVGKDYALGLEEAVTWVNDNGGINGKQIKLHMFDYGYKRDEAVTLYDKLKTREGVIAVLGWGTGDTEALSQTVSKDKIPYVSASYSAHLTDPTKTPYNIFFSPDYSSSARAAVTAWYDEIWMKDDKYKSRREGGEKPRLMCFYHHAHPYCSAPIKAVKEQAEMLGFEIGQSQDVSLKALDAKTQVLAAKRFKADLIWHGNTTQSVSVVLKDSRTLQLGAYHAINVWGFDENLPRLAGSAAENAIGVAPSAYYGQDVPGMDDVMKYTEKVNPGVSQDKRLIRTIQAWGAVKVLAEGMRRADKAGELTGETILKEGIETMRGYDIGLGAAPVSYTPDDHRPTSKVNVFIYRDGKFQELSRIDLKARWPEKWNNEWLGY